MSLFLVRRLIPAALAISALALTACSSSHTQPTAALRAASAASPTPAPTVSPSPAPLTSTAAVTRRHPRTGTKVGVSVVTAAGARIRAVAHFEAGDLRKTARADSAGLHRFWFSLGSAPAGIRVTVTVRVFAHGQKRSTRVWFTPRQPSPPPVAAPAPAPRHNSGAWCTATADYNAQYNDYDIYVHSNQPNRRAVATASNGERQPYDTDSNGYADIYLYADPGDTVTVTVGAASCSTTA